MNTPISEKEIRDALVKARQTPFGFAKIELGTSPSRFVMCCQPVPSPIQRHPEWELISMISGKVEVVLFDSNLTETERHLLDASNPVFEIPGDTVHSVTAVTEAVFLEVKPGESRPLFFSKR